MLSNTAEYALGAVLYLAAHDVGGPVRVGEIADSLSLPQNYLSKILQELAHAGVLQSSRGKHGGFRLAKPASEVSLLDSVSRFDSISAERRCLLGRQRCSDGRACVVHKHWRNISEQVTGFFRTTTVGDLLAGVPTPV